MMRLTELPTEVQAYIALGQLSAGHARADRRARSAGCGERIVERPACAGRALAHDEGVPGASHQRRAAAR